MTSAKSKDRSKLFVDRARFKLKTPKSRALLLKSGKAVELGMAC